MAKRRDYVTDMTDYIKARLPEGDYVAIQVGRDITDQLQQDDPDLLTGWLMINAPHMVAKQLGRLRVANHSRARRSLKRERFAQATAAFDQGNPEPLKDYLKELSYSTPGNVIKELGNLTSADCRFIASKYQDLSATYNLEAVFMDVLARKVPSGTVSDHFSDEEIRALRSNVADAIQHRTAVISA